jgi:hypothetical protein
VGEKAGVASRAWTLASAALDLNRDGYPDFWLANDFGRDQVFLNQKDGTFIDVASLLGADDRGSGMNVSLVDINHDTQPDVLVSMIEMFSKTLRFILPTPSDTVNVDDRVLATSYYISGNKLFVSQSSDEAAKANPIAQLLQDETGPRLDARRKGWAWGVAFFDYENDGDADAYLANGWIEQSAFFQQPNQLMLNQEGRLFSVGPSVSEKTVSKAEYPEAVPSSSRAVVAVDLENRGVKDLVVLDYERGLRVFRNVSAPGNFLKVALDTRGSNRTAIGAKVTVYVDGLKPQTSFVSAGSEYLGQTELPLTFGLGGAEKAERVVVVWADGKESEMTSGLSSGARITAH